MNEPDSLAQEVIALVASKRHLSPAQVTLDSSFAELGIDSLAGIDLLFDFEETFHLSIPDDVARNMRSVGQAVEAIRAARSGAAFSPE